jgi:predicted amidophosphoribosyltransferase
MQTHPKPLSTFPRLKDVYYKKNKNKKMCLKSKKKKRKRKNWFICKKKKNPLSTFPLCGRSEMPIHKHSMMLTYSRAKRRLVVLGKYDKYKRKLVSPTLLCKKGVL